MMLQDPIIQTNEPSQRKLYDLTKRLFDIALVLLSLPFLVLSLLIISILIRIESPGPVFLRQKRIGRLGKRFDLLRFRTIYVELDQEKLRSLRDRSGEAVFKLANDPRLTRVGRFLHKTSLDELPMVINVLRGEMSLVGPRPSLPFEAELYTDWQKRRFEAKPGLTGLWQVSGFKRINFDDMLRMDLEYIDHPSIWLDLKIILKTVGAVMRANGAY